MKAFTRLRYIDGDGQKRAEYALDRRDTSPRYEGDPEPLLCRYCDYEWPHSVALHEKACLAGPMMEMAKGSLIQEAAMKVHRYEVTFIDGDGEQVAKTVTARHEFEAAQLAGATGKVVVSIVNLDL